MAAETNIKSKKTVKKNRSGRLRKVFCIIGFIVTAFLLILFLLGALLLDKPKKYPLPQLSTDIMTANMGVIHRIMPEISVQFPKDEAELILTPQEVNNLLDALRTLHAATGSQFKGPTADSYSITCRDRMFTLQCSVSESGLSSNIYAEFIPKFDSGIISADIEKFKIGNVRFPAWFAEGRVLQANALLRKMPEYQILCKMLISLTVLPDGSIKIVYNPARIMEEMPGGFNGVHAARRMLQRQAVTPELLRFLKSSNFDPEQLRGIQRFKFDPSILNELGPAELSPALYDELKKGEFNPERLIPLLKR